MREILFRGKLRGGRWAEGNLEVKKDFVCIITPDDTPLGCYGAVFPDTVGQYTGLTDKNGKKIFEGDIVKAVSHDYTGDMFIGPVLFKDGCYCIKYVTLPELRKLCPHEKPSYSFYRIGEIGRWQDMGASGNVTYTYEVIGNIHDNPELLKGGAS